MDSHENARKRAARISILQKRSQLGLGCGQPLASASLGPKVDAVKVRKTFYVEFRGDFGRFVGGARLDSKPLWAL